MSVLPEVRNTPSPSKKGPAIPFGERVLASWEREGEDKPFKEYKDVSAANAGKHDSSREDTFRTPASLHKRFATPLRQDKRYGLGDTKDLQAICEQGFAKCMHRIQAQLLEQVRSELAEPLVEVHKQLADHHERDALINETLSRVAEQVNQIQLDVKRPNVDFEPLQVYLKEFHENEVTQLQACSDSLQHVEGRLSQDVSQVLGTLQVIQQKQNELETGVMTQMRKEIHEIFQDRSAFDNLSRQCESQMSNILQQQHSLEAKYVETAKEIHSMHEHNIEHHTGIAPLFEDKLSRQAQELALPDNFQRVLWQVKTSQEVINADTRVVLGELTKIQQALNVDFAHVIDEMGNSIDAPIELPSQRIREEAPPAMKEPQGEAEENVEAKAVAQEEPAQDAGGPREGRHVQITKKRFRELGTNTELRRLKDEGSQTDEALLKAYVKKIHEKHTIKKKKEPDTPTPYKGVFPEKKNKAMFADKEELKKRMRAQLLKPQYNVQDHYHKTGCARTIATHMLFENVTLVVILANAIWIAIDTDLNDAEMLIDADLPFIIVENCFCFYFTVELLVRFCAFEAKRNCFRDFWFSFDSALVSLMIVETWIVPSIMLILGVKGSSASMGNASILRMVRMVRMLRVGRMARLMRSIPELVILIKGIRAASRSVCVFFLLWLMIIYIFAIVFKQLTHGKSIGDKYFNSVPEAMNTLLLDGILPDSSEFVNDVTDAHLLFWPLIMFFIMLAGVTVMYMLVGVLVEVVGVIAAAEKEGMTVTNIAGELSRAMRGVGFDTAAPITQYEFNKLLAEPQVAGIMHHADVDVLMLYDMSDVIFENPDMEATGLTFEMFVEIVLNTRGNNTATVKDVKEQLRIMKRVVNLAAESIFASVKSEFNALYEQIWELRQADLQDLEDLEAKQAEQLAAQQLASAQTYQMTSFGTTLVSDSS